MLVARQQQVKPRVRLTHAWFGEGPYEYGKMPPLHLERICLSVMEQVFVRAYAAHRDGRLDDAERGYRATLAADPVHVDALHLLGVLRHQQGQHAEAADLVRRAVELRPDDA